MDWIYLAPVTTSGGLFWIQ